MWRYCAIVKYSINSHTCILGISLVPRLSGKNELLYAGVYMWPEANKELSLSRAVAYLGFCEGVACRAQVLKPHPVNYMHARE